MIGNFRWIEFYSFDFDSNREPGIEKLTFKDTFLSPSCHSYRVPTNFDFWKLNSFSLLPRTKGGVRLRTEGLPKYCFAVRHYQPSIALASLWLKPLFLPQSGIHSPIYLKGRAYKMKVFAINHNVKIYGYNLALLGGKPKNPLPGAIRYRDKLSIKSPHTGRGS